MPVDDCKLTEYALGILTADERDSVERELSASVEMQKELDTIEEALANLAFAENPLRPSDELRDAVLASVNAETRFEGFVDRLASLFDLGEEPVRELLAKIDDTSNNIWESTIIPGVRILRFSGGPRLADATCGIVHVKPGRIFPAHRHQDEELSLVLQGRAREDTGLIFQPGDINRRSAGSEHTFQTFGHEPLIFAVVLRKENKWLIGRTILDRIFAKWRFRPDLEE